MIVLTKDGLTITGETIYVDAALRERWSWSEYTKLRMIIRCKFEFNEEKPRKCCKMALDAFKEFDGSEQYLKMPVIIAQNQLVDK
jgi:hypothetical protein